MLHDHFLGEWQLQLALLVDETAHGVCRWPVWRVRERACVRERVRALNTHGEFTHTSSRYAVIYPLS